MNISWFGLGCFKINTKYNGVESTVLIDPFDEKSGNAKLPRRAGSSVDILIDPKNKTGIESKFLIDGPGEFEVGGTFVWGIPLNGAGHLIYKIEAEDMIMVHTGALNRVPDDAELEGIENVDVLFVPIGGKGVLNAAQAVELITRLEPRVVIPMWFKAPGVGSELDGPEGFLKAMSSKAEPQPRLKIAKKDLPTERIDIMLLNLDES